MSKKKYNDALNELIITSGDITGSLAGAGLGLLLGGPGGVLLGAAAGPAITKALKSMASEIKSRVIGNREEVRIGAAFTYSLIKIEKNLEQGKEIQGQYLNDNFSDQTRSTAKEALEGILLAAQREFEEKKIKYIGNFYGNVLFEYHYRAYISSLIKLIESLSYRQLIMIKLFSDVKKYKLDVPIFSPDFDSKKLDKYLGYTDQRVVSTDVMIEARDLSSKMIIVNKGDKEQLYFNYSLTLFGEKLMNLMELSDIPDSEVEACANQIRGFLI